MLARPQISKLTTLITKVYYSNTIAEIINDILEQVNAELGEKYKLEFIDNKFHISPFKKITVNFRYKTTEPCGKGATNEHGTIKGSGEYQANGKIVNTDTLIIGDRVKVTPVENGQKWIVDFKIRKIK